MLNQCVCALRLGAISIGDAKAKAGSWVDLMNAAVWHGQWMRECWRVFKPDGYLVVFLNWRSLSIMLKACADSRMPATSLAVWDRHGSQTASEPVCPCCGKEMTLLRLIERSPRWMLAARAPPPVMPTG